MWRVWTVLRFVGSAMMVDRAVSRVKDIVYKIPFCHNLLICNIAITNEIKLVGVLQTINPNNNRYKTYQPAYAKCYWIHIFSIKPYPLKLQNIF